MGEEGATRPLTRPYTPAEVELGLRALVLAGGNSKQAAEMLAEDLPLDSSTLRRWRTKDHRERYLEIAAELQPELEKAVVASTLDYLQESEELKRDLLGVLKEQVDAKEIKDPAKSLQNLAVSQGIGIDTVLKVQGRPTQLIQHTSVDDSVATLKRLGIVVDSDAEEISEAEVVEAEKPEGRAVAAIQAETHSQTHDPSAPSS